MIVENGVRLSFRYAAGPVAGAALTALRDDGRLLGARCSGCGQVVCPARSLCPACGGRAEELVDVGPEGRLVSWTDVPGRGTYALVRLDGADTALVHRLLDPGARLVIGVRVRARLAVERSASILDVEGFEVVS